MDPCFSSSSMVSNHLSHYPSLSLLMCMWPIPKSMTFSTFGRITMPHSSCLLFQVQRRKKEHCSSCISTEQQGRALPQASRCLASRLFRIPNAGTQSSLMEDIGSLLKILMHQISFVGFTFVRILTVGVVKEGRDIPKPIQPLRAAGWFHF